MTSSAKILKIMIGANRIQSGEANLVALWASLISSSTLNFLEAEDMIGCWCIHCSVFNNKDENEIDS